MLKSESAWAVANAALPKSGGTVTGLTTYSFNGVAVSITPGKLQILSALANTAVAALQVQSNINTATTQSARNIDSIIGSVTGTYSGASAVWGNQFATQSFNADVLVPAEYINFASSVTFGGANTKGSVAATRNLMVMSANSANAAGSRSFHRALAANAQTAFTDGGVPGNVAGNWFGGIIDCSLLSGATNWNSIVGLEIDVTTATGSSADYKIGLQIVLKSNDGVQSAVQNSFLATAAQVGWVGVGMTAGITFGAPNGVWAYDTSSTTAFLLGALATALGGNAYQIAYGMKLDNVTFTQAFLQSTGFKVDGSGSTTAASYAVGASGPTWTSGSAAPASTQPKGSLYSRTGGGVGSTLYVSQGGGTWNPVAGV